MVRGNASRATGGAGCLRAPLGRRTRARASATRTTPAGGTCAIVELRSTCPPQRRGTRRGRRRRHRRRRPTSSSRLDARAARRVRAGKRADLRAACPGRRAERGRGPGARRRTRMYGDEQAPRVRRAESLERRPDPSGGCGPKTMPAGSSRSRSVRCACSRRRGPRRRQEDAEDAGVAKRGVASRALSPMPARLRPRSTRRLRCRRRSPCFRGRWRHPNPPSEEWNVTQTRARALGARRAAAPLSASN